MVDLPEEFNVAYKLERILELNLLDCRDQSRIIYPLFVIGTVIVMAKMAKCENCWAIREYWRVNLPLLKERIYGLGDEIPTAQTIRRVQTILNTENLHQVFVEYFTAKREYVNLPKSAIALKDRDVISADGQNIRATRSHATGDARNTTGYDVVSMYSSKYGLTLAQKTVDKKGQEAECIKELLNLVIVKNAILTWDAINTHPDTINAVVGAGADAVTCLKENCGLIYDDVVTAFEYFDKGKFPGEYAQSSQVTSEHGRIEEKTITILEFKYCATKPVQKKWKHIKCAIRVRTKRTEKISGKVTENDAYFITTIDLDGLNPEEFAAQMQQIILQRWAIEARHFIIDCYFEQDRLPLRNQDYISNSTFFTKEAVNILSWNREQLPERYKRKISFPNLQVLCSRADVCIAMLDAYFNKDISYIRKEEEVAKLFYGEEEPTGNDVPENLEETGFQSSINDDTPLGQFARTRKKIKGKRRD